MLNRANALFAREADSADKIAIRFEGDETSFAALAGRVRKMAGALAALGVARGVHVGLLLPASPEFIVVEQALFMLGAPITPINILYRPAEIVHAAECCDLAFIITTDTLADAAASALPASCRLLLVDTAADGEAGASIPSALAAASPLASLAPIGANDAVFHLLTSATTGKAKGVILTAGNLAANYDRTPGWLGLDADDVILCALPLYNTFGLNQCINAMLVTGATLVLLPRFDAACCIEAIAKFGCTFLPAVPTMLQKIFDHPTASDPRLRSLRRIMTGGAPVPSALLQRIITTAPSVQVLTGYGLTEGTALVTLTEVRLSPDGGLERGRTIGRVLDGMELAIVDDSGNRCPADTAGEIVVAGPNLMAGYYKAPDDSAAALRGGWLHTGDIGYIDDEGYVYIVDRKKDVIIRGGQNIYPADIEEVLYQAPGVAEVAVVGREDEMMGEVPIAFVAGTTALSAERLLDHCREHLARYKVPAEIDILPELPKGPTGKILRRALRDKARHAV